MPSVAVQRPISLATIAGIRIAICAAASFLDSPSIRVAPVEEVPPGEQSRCAVVPLPGEHHARSVEVPLPPHLPPCEVLPPTQSLRTLTPRGLTECQHQIAALSPCLPYIGGHPQPAPAPSRLCCQTFYESLQNAGPLCVCDLVRNPLITGFVLATGRLFALFPVCGQDTISAATCTFTVHAA